MGHPLHMFSLGLMLPLTIVPGCLATTKAEPPIDVSKQARPAKKIEPRNISREPHLVASNRKYDLEKKLLKDARININDNALLAYLAKQSGQDSEYLKLNKWIRQLGNENFKLRQEASKKLVQLGPCVLRGLMEARSSSSPEVARRARQCINKINENFDWALPWASVRLLLQSKPFGTAQAFLRFLPYAIDAETIEEIWYGLNALAMNQAKVVHILESALVDSLPPRRAVAACILGRIGNHKQRAAVHILLKDSDAEVRLRAAQGLLAGKDKAGIPVLITLLSTAPVEIGWQAEELLYWVAGDKAPNGTIGAASGQTPKQCGANWAAWWRKHGQQVDVGKVEQDPKRPGLLLIGDYRITNQATGNRVWLCGCDGKPRWEVNNIERPRQVELVVGNHILMSGEKEAIEWDLQGNKVWRLGLPYGRIIACRRLPNGNTFVCTKEGVKEITAEGKERYAHKHTREWEGDGLRKRGGIHWVEKAQQIGRGLIIFISEEDGSTFTVDTKTGKKISVLGWKFEKKEGHPYWPRGATMAEKRKVIQRWEREKQPRVPYRILPTGTILVHNIAKGQIELVNMFGKTLCEVPTHGDVGPAGTLRNANLLVLQWGEINRVMEINNNGKVLWQAFTADRPWCANVCLGLVRFGFDRAAGPEANQESLRYLIKLLASDNPEVRRSAALLIKRKGTNAREAVAALLTVPIETDHVSRQAVIDAIIAIGPQCVPILVKGLTAHNNIVRSSASVHLGNYPKQAAVYIPALIKAARDGDPIVRLGIVATLGRIKQKQEVTLPVVLEALKDPDARVRYMAAESLEMMRPPASAAIPVLMEAIRLTGKENTKLTKLTLDQIAGRRAVEALSRIGRDNEQVIKFLIKLVAKKGPPWIRGTAAMELGKMGRKAKKALPILISVLKSPEETDPSAKELLRRIILMAFAEFGNDATEAVPAIVDVFKNKKDPVSEDAAITLERLGPAAKQAIPALTEALQDKDEKRREIAARAIQQIRIKK